jgi:hypothetical protein
VLPLPWIDALFSRFEGLYGAQFTDKWKHVDISNAKQVWADTLDGVSGERIKLALIECGKTCKFPPSAPEFYQLCRNAIPAACHQKFLPNLHVKNTSVGRAKINEIKEMLAKKMTEASHEPA